MGRSFAIIFQITIPRNVSLAARIAQKEMYVDVIVEMVSRVSLVLNLTFFFSFTRFVFRFNPTHRSQRLFQNKSSTLNTPEQLML